MIFFAFVLFFFVLFCCCFNSKVCCFLPRVSCISFPPMWLSCSFFRYYEWSKQEEKTHTESYYELVVSTTLSPTHLVNWWRDSSNGNTHRKSIFIHQKSPSLSFIKTWRNQHWITLVDNVERSRTELITISMWWHIVRICHGRAVSFHIWIRLYCSFELIVSLFFQQSSDAFKTIGFENPCFICEYQQSLPY